MITINKPKYEKREIVGGKLKNDIKYVLMSDPFLQKSFVSVSINIGSFANPKEYMGLAHFLEHMLFLGSTKYPDENHYNNRLNELGGYSNAYTTYNKTVYFFNVFDNGLSEIIDIFSRFFIDPLFNIDSVKREMNAVNNEHKKNVNSMMWRNQQLRLNLTNMESSTNTFSTGNLDTLDKDDIRDKMIEFYKKYYNSNNISICIGSSKPITELKDIIEGTFGLIKSAESESSIFKIMKPIYSENRNKTFYEQTLVKTFDLTYIFEIPLYNYDFTILKSILLNRSKNSLYFHLKNLGLISMINIDIDNDVMGLFTINIYLTEKGFEKIKIINSLMMITLNNIIENCDFEEYAKYYQKISYINWKYLSKIDAESLCNMLSENHFYTMTKNVYEYSFTIRDIKSNNNYKKLYQKYINSDNLLKIISSQNYPEIKNNFKFNTVKYYGTKYTELQSNLSQNIKNIQFEWGTPTNDYLEIKPIIFSDLDKYNIPINIGTRQWYGACSQFGEPDVNIRLQMNNTKYFNTPKNYTLTNISCSMLNFLASTILYKPLEVAYNVSFVPSNTYSNININISGLNDTKKLLLLVNDLNQFITNIKDHLKKISTDYIENLIIEYKQNLENIRFFNPSQYSSYIIQEKLFSTSYDSSILLEELNKMIINNQYNTMEEYIYNMFVGNTALTTIIYGNIIKDDIKDAFNLPLYQKLFSNSIFQLPTVNLVENMELTHPNIDEHSNCITHYYYVGKFIPKNIILLFLTTNILGEKFYDELRTKKQLGYLVNLSSKVIMNDYYIVMTIQSDKSSKEVEEHMKQFNDNIIDMIKKVDIKKFIETLELELNEPEYSMDEKFARYLPEITSREYLFNRKQLLLDKLQQYKKSATIMETLIDFVTTYIKPSNMKRIIINGNI